MNTKPTVVKLKNVSMTYHTKNEETKALDNINFSVYDKEFLTIVGPSGCGKSTILSLISGLITPSNGTVEIGLKKGKNSDKNSNKSGSDAVAYMLQKDHLFEWRTIEQNAFLGLEIKKSLSDSTKKYATDLLKRYGLGKFLNHYPGQLSGGMRQRAALIRTLAVNPEILLLDEPFSALDYQTRILVSEEIKKIITKENKTAILVSHDISEAILLSDRILILSQAPSTIKTTLNVTFDEDNLTLAQKRNNKKFNEYFDFIWKELDSSGT